MHTIEKELLDKLNKVYPKTLPGDELMKESKHSMDDVKNVIEDLIDEGYIKKIPKDLDTPAVIVNKKKTEDGFSSNISHPYSIEDDYRITPKGRNRLEKEKE